MRSDRARFTTTRRSGHSRPALSTAGRIRSRASCTPAPGRPVRVSDGSPRPTCASTARWPRTPTTVTPLTRPYTVADPSGGHRHLERVLVDLDVRAAWTEPDARDVEAHARVLEAFPCRNASASFGPSCVWLSSPPRSRHRTQPRARLHLAHDQQVPAHDDEVELSEAIASCARPARTLAARRRSAASSPVRPRSERRSVVDRLTRRR